MTTATPEPRQLGRSGLTVSAVGLGCNTLGATVPADDAPAVVHAALDAGVTFFDTADIYGGTPGQSEEILGRALGRHHAVLGSRHPWRPGQAVAAARRRQRAHRHSATRKQQTSL